MIRIENNVFIPMPMAIIGTMHEGRPNFMAAGWNTRANANPPMIAVGIGQSHCTHDCIMESRSFSLNIPGNNLLVETDYVGIVSGKKTDKSAVFDVFYGENKNIPLIKNAVVALECKLVQAVELPTNTLFIGEIAVAWGKEEFLLKNSNPDYKKGKACFLTMPDNTYWSIGENLGKAWSMGNALKK